MKLTSGDLALIAAVAAAVGALAAAVVGGFFGLWGGWRQRVHASRLQLWQIAQRLQEQRHDRLYDHLVEFAQALFDLQDYVEILKFRRRPLKSTNEEVVRKFADLAHVMRRRFEAVRPPLVLDPQGEHLMKGFSDLSHKVNRYEADLDLTPQEWDQLGRSAADMVKTWEDGPKAILADLKLLLDEARMLEVELTTPVPMPSGWWSQRWTALRIRSERRRLKR